MIGLQTTEKNHRYEKVIMSAGSALRPATIGYTNTWGTNAIPAINGAFNSSYNKTGIMRTVTIKHYMDNNHPKSK